MTTKEREAARARTVRKANILIQRGRNKLSLRGQKILMYLISQIKPDDDDFKIYSFPLGDFCETCGIEINGKNYDDLKNAIIDIAEHPLGMLTMEDGRITTLMWLQKATIIPNEGTIQIKLDEDLKPYLIGLKDHYTKYQIGIPLRFRSRYTVIMYELISSYLYRETYSKNITVDSLREILDTEGKYTAYRDFKRRCLSIAITEINSKSDKNISMIEHKEGRAGKVKSITLSISTKQGEALDTVRQAAGLPAQQAQGSDKPQPPKRSARVPPARRIEFKCEANGDELTPSRRQKLESMKRLKDAI